MPQIMPIKELKDTSHISELCHKADEPIYITKNGYGDMVLMSIELFEATQNRWSMYRDVEISEQQIKEGRVKNAREALSSMREKYGL
ncbi:MAG: type II toxin-antitoxin system Phd/YefM family antitoxin [Lachnospiraceae bacterium]|nr:type II toxin-antitoxin system Phd/YefM family antitoxin [Lachnospiraceae bacterium]